jgi:hypothetical protein
MKNLVNRFLLSLTLVGLVAALTPAWGQEVTASIVGTVTDSSGAPINGAAVTARDTERGTLWTATTSDAGAYNITLLPVGTYEVKVTAPGFQTAVHPPFVLVLNQTARVGVTTNVDPDGMRQPQSMTNSGRPYINGNREQANEYLIDGILNSEDKNDEVGYTPERSTPSRNST